MKNMFKFISGMVVGTIFGGLAIVCANQAISAIQNTEIKVSLNGEVQEFVDEATNDIQYPITYDNRTYLPLRNVANLAGLAVDYDKSSNTAILTNSYTNAQLKELAKIYCQVKNGFVPSYFDVENVNDEMVSIHAYSIVDNHTTTTDWYTVSRLTGKGTNVLEETVDLSIEGIIDLIDFDSDSAEIYIVKEAFLKSVKEKSYYDEDSTLIARSSYDIDGDGKKEYIFITNYFGENNISIYNSNGAKFADGLDELYGNINRFEIVEGNEGPILYINKFDADGVCYECSEAYEARYKDGAFELKKIAYYTCDSEKENEIRDPLTHPDGSALTDEEEKIYNNAHILKYLVDSKVVTKSEYEDFITNYEMEHKIIKKII